jgi:hypothetical protein
VSDDPFPLAAADERELASVLDELIPPSPDGRFPGAGELGLVAAIAQAAKQNPALGPSIAQGLRALADRARDRRGCAFSALPAEERTECLSEVAAADPAFVPSLAFPSYVAYYQHPRVMEALGPEHRPPHPKGYKIKTIDKLFLHRGRPSPNK